TSHRRTQRSGHLITSHGHLCTPRHGSRSITQSIRHARLAQELADLKTAHQDLADDIAKYKANTGIDSADAGATAPEPAKPRRARKPTK
ncbi:hypothetical protein AB0M08_47505, partial [Actinoplanes sp. NPDC051851]